MQILIDATPLLLRSAGVKNYTYYWIQHLRQQAGNDRILTVPSLDELRARIVGLIQAPASKIARTINEPGAMLARVIGAYAAKEAA